MKVLDTTPILAKGTLTSPLSLSILRLLSDCGAFRCDHDDRMGFNGQIQLRRTNMRCIDQGFGVSLEMVCDRHQFRHADRRDV